MHAATDILSIDIRSVAWMDSDRVVEVARAFDAEPALRPRRAGPSDPLRLQVEPSLEALLARESLPVSWFLRRRMRPVYEGGELELRRKRGVEMNWGVLTHSLWVGYAAEPYARGDHELEPLVDLFVRLCDAMDAFYGRLYSRGLWGHTTRLVNGMRRQASMAKELPDVPWLTFFGPAYLKRWGDRLDGVGWEQRRHGRGLLVWATETPFVDDPDPRAPRADAWKQPFYEALGIDTFAGPVRRSEPGDVPSIEDHMRETPGPLETWRPPPVVRRSRGNASRARARTDELLAGRESLPPSSGRHEFSASVDLDVAVDLLRSAASILGGDFAGALGETVIAEIVAAEDGFERSLELAAATQAGPELVELSYLRDDATTVELQMLGSETVAGLLYAELAPLAA